MGERRYAILIGNSRYPEDPKGLRDLRCPINDVDGLYDIFNSEKHGIFDEIVPLKNKKSDLIVKEVHDVLARATKDDLVLIYYSGHGRRNLRGRLHLTAVNTKATRLESTAVSTSSILDLLDVSPPKKIILILDCCFSGAIGKDIFKGGVDEQLQEASRARGCYILSASTAFDVAKEDERGNYSILTKHIIEGIRSGKADLDDDGRVNMSELYTYAERRMSEEKCSHYPVKFDLNIQGEFLVIAKTGRGKGYNQRERDQLKSHSRRVFGERLRIIAQTVGGGIGAGLGLGLLRMLIALFIPGMLIGPIFFVFTVSGALLGSFLTLGLALTEHLFSAELGGESAAFHRASRRLGRRPFLLATVLGALFFGLGHAILTVFNGISFVQNPATALWVAVMGFVAGAGLSVGAYTEPQSAGRSNISGWLLKVGVAGLTFVLVQSFFLASPDRGVGIATAWHGEFYRRYFSYGNLTLLDALLCGVIMAIGIRLGLGFADDLMEKWLPVISD